MKISRTTERKACVIVQACHPWEAETQGSWASQPQIPLTDDLKTRQSVSEERHVRLTSGLHTYVRTCALEHAHTHNPSLRRVEAGGLLGTTGCQPSPRFRERPCPKEKDGERQSRALRVFLRTLGAPTHAHAHTHGPHPLACMDALTFTCMHAHTHRCIHKYPHFPDPNTSIKNLPQTPGSHSQASILSGS